MKRIGLIGGMSWESTQDYYRLLNQTAAARLGGLHSADCLLASLDFQPIEEMQHRGEWDALGKLLAGTARTLEQGGAEIILLCTNTMHIVAEDIEPAVTAQFIHIADAAATECSSAGARTVGLLGTKFTMEKAFFVDRLSSRGGLQVITPESEERDAIHAIIYDELCKGTILAESREIMTGITESLRSRGADAVIMGCTEIPMLLEQERCSVPLVDTVKAHVKQAAKQAFGPNPSP